LLRRSETVWLQGGREVAVHDTRLEELLDAVRTGKIQLPDFQRDWKWDDGRIRSLLATVTQEFPLGVIMSLETGGTAPQFKPRPLAGTQVPAGTPPEHLLLDGQQRLTALYQALVAQQPVETKDSRDNDISVWYYIDIVKATGSEEDREDAILAVPASRILRRSPSRGDVLDLSSRDKECAAGLFPLNLCFDRRTLRAWQRAYEDRDEARERHWENFDAGVLKQIEQFQVPWVKLRKDTSTEAVCVVFERVNTGGLNLNVFELLTATYAGNRAYADEHGKEFNLRGDWERIKDGLAEKYPVLEKLASLEFLQALALVLSYRRRRQFLAEHPNSSEAPSIRCKRKDLLALPLSDYREWTPKITHAFAWASEFLSEQCVFREAELPYQTQLVPLATIRVILGDAIDTPQARKKIVQWYWCGVFGELYGSTTDTRFAKDIEQVIDWIEGGSEPDTVTEASFQEQRLRSMSSKLSAAYKGVFALLLQHGCYDWYASASPISGESLVAEAVDFRLVFPKAWFDSAALKNAHVTSVVNKTPLSTRAAKTIGTRAPAVYLDMFARESGAQPEWVDDLVESHFIDPKTLRANDYEAFYRDRTEQLLGLIESAMGKPVVRAASAASAI